MFKKYNRSNQQLVAHCYFSISGITYENYEKYYEDTSNKSEK